MLRIVLFIHRYLAVAVGLLMALWCLSGFVMMYQPYPALTTGERLAGLAPLQLEDCCQTGLLPEAESPAGDFRIEMLDGRPVLRRAGATPVDLGTGQPVTALQPSQLQRVAAEHARRRGLNGEPRWLGEIEELDQWTIQTARRNRPVHHFALDDAAGTQLYLNGTTGEVFQDTNRRERLLTWLGAIPHWLYPAFLRSNGPLWTQVVIWTSVIGTFLTLTGLYVGIARLRRRRAAGGSISPFRGWWYWHHIAGLAFGLLTLTWVFSGLLTMYPWGWLEGGDAAQRVQPRLTGSPPTTQLAQLLGAAPALVAQHGFVQLRAAPLGNRLFVLGQRADGSSLRLDATGQPAPLEAAEVQQAFAALDTGLTSLELLHAEDAYYYGHKREASLPVWRAVLDDAQRTRVYVAAATGEIRLVDGAARQARWLVQGLHSLDFRGLRQRPVWDIVVLLLLAGVSVLCITGSWLAIQRLRRDLSRS